MKKKVILLIFYQNIYIYLNHLITKKKKNHEILLPLLIHEKQKIEFPFRTLYI
jgi:hypothetical protein